MSNEHINRVRDLQKEMHEFIEDVMSNSPRVTYTDAVTIFMLNKIAELQLMVAEPISLTSN